LTQARNGRGKPRPYEPTDETCRLAKQAVVFVALYKRPTYKGGGLRFAMGSRSLFEPRGRVLNGFTAHSQPVTDPSPYADPSLEQEVF